MTATNSATQTFFITCPKGLETLVSLECDALNILVEKSIVGGVYCQSDWHTMYRFCLYTRFANRVIWLLQQVNVASKDDIYHKIKAIGWSGCFTSGKTMAVEFKGTNRYINHTNYGALLVKDAIVDHFVDAAGIRPDVDVKAPDVRVWVHLKRQQLNVGIDLIGRSLHKRGYRLDGAKAPLKENLAAALAYRAGVDEKDNRLLIDPMCGSGTLLIEAALMKLKIAPNLVDESFGLQHLMNYQADIWESLRQEAQRHKDATLQHATILGYGYDEDKAVIASAKTNAHRAGLSDFLVFKQRSLKDFVLPVETDHGLVMVNPPYGERLGQKEALYPVYRLLGEVCRSQCQGFDVAILSSDTDLTKSIGLQKSKVYQFYNGPIPASWTLYHIYQSRQNDNDEKSVGMSKSDQRFNQGVDMVRNRLTKNKKRLSKWVKRENIEAFRLYDADMPEYAFAVDYYDGFYQVTEYQAPKTIDQFSVQSRRQQFMAALKEVSGTNSNKIILKQRKQQKGLEQYQKLDESSHFFPVMESGIKVLVNLYDYLDTGLFLDHRPIRNYIGQKSRGTRFLNLFAYTSVATLHAVKGGAIASVSVDMSKTYQNWSARNFRANNISQDNHRLVNDNCMAFIAACHEKFDLIFLDPPSFSNSKKMAGTLDIQRDHVELIRKTTRLLAPGGTLIFSNNLKGFKLDPALELTMNIQNFQKQSIDLDFASRVNVHHCWLIRNKSINEE